MYVFLDSYAQLGVRLARDAQLRRVAGEANRRFIGKAGQRH
jgi:hypothetical protein